MPEQLADQDSLLACRAEGRPVRRNGRIEVNQTLLHLGEESQRSHRLGDRPDLGDRVANPGDSWSGLAAPEVDDELAVVHHRDAGTGVETGFKVALQELPQRAECISTGSVDTRSVDTRSVDTRSVDHGVTLERVLIRGNVLGAWHQ
jgi:hypothetical protein